MRSIALPFGLALALAPGAAAAKRAPEVSGWHLGADEGLTNGTVGETVDLNTVLVFDAHAGYRAVLGDGWSLDVDAWASYEPRKASPTDRITLLTVLVGPLLRLDVTDRWSLFGGGGIGPLWIFDVQDGDVLFANPEARPSANPLLLLDLRAQLGAGVALTEAVDLTLSFSLDQAPEIQGLVGGVFRRTIAIGLVAEL